MYTPYEIIKFWLPVVSAFTVVIKAYLTVKDKVAKWADKFLNNHLHTIEDAVKANAQEALETNILLRAAAEREMSVSNKLDMVQNTIHEHRVQEAAVWKDTIEALTVLKERTRA